MSDAAANPVPSSSPEASSIAPDTSSAPNFAGTKHKIDWEDGNSEELGYEDLISNYKTTRKESAKLKSEMDTALTYLKGLQGGNLDSLSAIVPEDMLLEYAERALTKRLEWEQMSPEQKEMVNKERQLAERERAYKEWEAQRQAQEQEVINQRALQDVQNDIVEAIKDLGLEGPPTPRLVRRVAEQLKAQIESEGKMDARRASRSEWDNIGKELSDFQLMMLKKDPSKFVEGLPKEVRKAIREYEINAGTPFKKFTQNNSTDSGSSERKYGFDELDKIYGSKNRRKA